MSEAAPRSPSAPVEPRFYSIRKAAEYCGMGQWWVRREIAAGRLQAYKQGPAGRRGVKVLVDRADLDRLIMGNPVVSE